MLFDQITFFTLNFLFFLSLQSFKSVVRDRNFFKGSMENIVENLDLAIVIKRSDADESDIYKNKLGHLVFKDI